MQLSEHGVEIAMLRNDYEKLKSDYDALFAKMRTDALIKLPKTSIAKG